MSIVQALASVPLYTYATMLAAFLCCLLRRRRYGLSVLQTVLLFVLYDGFSLFGNALAAYVLMGYWGGSRWYGVPLMALLAIWLMSKVLKKDFGAIGDLMAAVVCTHHVLAKVGCIINGCCTGIILFFTDNGTAIHFPSRGFEILTNAVILFFLLRFEKKRIASGMLWEIYMIWYSVGAYAAAWLWEYPADRKLFLLWIPQGRLWILVICAVGFIILYFHFNKTYNRKPSAKELLRAVIGKFPQKEVVKNA